MADYSLQIDDMLWSYSRLSSFDDCPYGWYLKYIQHRHSDKPMFFSSYGSFVHKIMQLYLSGKLDRQGVVNYYLDNYDEQVVGEAPSEKVADGFFQKSLDYLETMEFPFNDIVTVEKKVEFDIEGYPFVGYIDVLARTGKQLHIIDHKSHGLRNRSGRKFQTEYDKELDRYLRQQYMYAIPIYNEYGKFPATLNFNCYRHGRFIREKFDPIQLHKTKVWVVEQIKTIREERDWEPNPEPFRCNFICDNAEFCKDCAKFSRRGK